MAETQKVLAQAAPAATTLTNVYTVPASTKTVVSTITVCNRSSTDGSFRIAVAADGEADTAKQYLYYDLPIPGNECFAATFGITLDAADVIRVYCSSASMSVNVFGVEITA